MKDKVEAILVELKLGLVDRAEALQAIMFYHQEEIDKEDI